MYPAPPVTSTFIFGSHSAVVEFMRVRGNHSLHRFRATGALQFPHDFTGSRLVVRHIVLAASVPLHGRIAEVEGQVTGLELAEVPAEAEQVPDHDPADVRDPDADVTQFVLSKRVSPEHKAIVSFMDPAGCGIHQR